MQKCIILDYFSKYVTKHALIVLAFFYYLSYFCHYYKMLARPKIIEHWNFLFKPILRSVKILIFQYYTNSKNWVLYWNLLEIIINANMPAITFRKAVCNPLKNKEKYKGLPISFIGSQMYCLFGSALKSFSNKHRMFFSEYARSI